MREPAEITKDSAAYIAKWRIRTILESDKSIGFVKKFAMEAAAKDGGGVDEIADVLYSLGLKLSIDMNNPVHKAWVEGRAVFLENE